MANTIKAENGLEIYQSEINRLADEYISGVLDIDIDRIKQTENKKMIAENFNDMILYIADRIKKPSNDDIELLDDIFEIYKRLCVRYGVLPTLETFSDLVSINNATFTDWMNEEYRAGSAHGKTVKKWKEECRGKLVDSLHQQPGTCANRIFIAKAAYGMVETAPRQIEAIDTQMPDQTAIDIAARHIGRTERPEMPDDLKTMLDEFPD